MAPALLLVPAALASFILAFGTGVEFVRFTSLRPLLGGMPDSGGPGEPEGPRLGSGAGRWSPRRGSGAGLVDRGLGSGGGEGTEEGSGTPRRGPAG